MPLVEPSGRLTRGSRCAPRYDNQVTHLAGGYLRCPVLRPLEELRLSSSTIPVWVAGRTTEVRNSYFHNRVPTTFCATDSSTTSSGWRVFAWTHNGPTAWHCSFQAFPPCGMRPRGQGTQAKTVNSGYMKGQRSGKPGRGRVSRTTPRRVSCEETTICSGQIMPCPSKE